MEMMIILTTIQDNQPEGKKIKPTNPPGIHHSRSVSAFFEDFD